MKDYTYIKNGESLSIREESCVGCGACLEVCPHGVLELRAGTARAEAAGAKVAAIRDRGLCMECGACARNCPAGAISVKAGVGCAAAIIAGKLTGQAPSCDCGSGKKASSGRACCG